MGAKSNFRTFRSCRQAPSERLIKRAAPGKICLFWEPKQMREKKEVSLSSFNKIQHVTPHTLLGTVTAILSMDILAIDCSK